MSDAAQTVRTLVAGMLRDLSSDVSQDIGQEPNYQYATQIRIERDAFPDRKDLAVALLAMSKYVEAAKVEAGAEARSYAPGPESAT